MLSCTCNPYLGGKLYLLCSIYHESGTANYTVNWWYNSSSDTVLTRLPGIQTSNRTHDINLVSELQVDLKEGNHSGNYWCQAAPSRTRNKNVSFVPSTVFTLHPRYKYTDYPPCNQLPLSHQLSMVASNGSRLLPVGITDSSTNINQQVNSMCKE